jgi:hypothetical protein
VTDQSDDVADARRSALYRISELRALPEDPDERPNSLTFTGSQYTPSFGRVSGYGEFAVDHEAQPPVLETRGYRVTYHIHPASISVFTDKAPVQRARMVVRPGRLWMCVNLDSSEPPSNFQGIVGKTIVVTFARLERRRSNRPIGVNRDTGRQLS